MKFTIKDGLLAPPKGSTWKEAKRFWNTFCTEPRPKDPESLYKGFPISQLRKEYEMEFCNISTSNYITLDCCASTVPDACAALVCKKEEKGNTMHYDDDGYAIPCNPERSYLGSRLNSVRYDAEQALMAKFYMQDDDAPNTPTDLVARITAGKYILPKDEKLAAMCYGNPMRAITWRDPAKPADKEGFKAAEATLNEAWTAAADIVATLPAADGLKALQEFKATKFAN